MTPARRRGTKKKTKAILLRCPRVRDGRYFNRTLLASSKCEPLAHLVWTNAIKVQVPSLGGSETRRNLYISSNKRATLPKHIYFMKYTICKNEIYTYETSNIILYCDKARMVQLKIKDFLAQIFNKITKFLVNAMKLKK